VDIPGRQLSADFVEKGSGVSGAFHLGKDGRQDGNPAAGWED
jgi:hypothetical protein